MDQGRISAGQLTLLVMSFTIGSWIVLPTGLQSGQNIWLIILFGLGGGMFFACLGLLLYRRFPGKNLFEIHELVFGPVIGKFFSLLYLWFFLQTGGGTLGVFVTMLKSTVFTATPDLALLVPWVIIVIYGCRRGIEVIARSNQPLILATVGLILISILLVLNIFEADNLLPFLDKPFSRIAWDALGVAVFPFGQGVIFMMILPRVNRQQKVAGAVFGGLIGAGLVLMIIQSLAVGVLGKVVEVLVFPTYEFYRIIDIAQVLTRLELIPLLNFLTMGFIKIMLCLYALAFGTAQLFNLRTYRPLAIPIGVLLLVVARRIFPSVSEHMRYFEEVQPYYGLFFCLVLPLITLGTALLRGRARREMAP
jgi:spore germination protein KB